MKSVIAGNWPSAKKAPKPVKHVNMATLTICDDPIPMERARAALKYEALFSAMKVGQAIKCESADTGKLSHALNIWIKAKKIEGVVVRSCKRYESDSLGRVWMIKK